MKEIQKISVNHRLAGKVQIIPGVTLSGSLFAVPSSQRIVVAQELSQSHITLHADIFSDETLGVSLEEIKILCEDSRNIIDVHLLTVEALRYLDQLCRLPVRKIIFPFEGVNNLEEIIQKTKAAGKQPWLAIAPETTVISCRPFLPFLDGVLVMLIPPGTT